MTIDNLIQYDDMTHTLSLKGDLTVVNLSSLMHELQRLIPKERLVMDYTLVSSVDTLAAQVLLDFEKKWRSKKISVEKHHMRPAVQEVLHFVQGLHTTSPARPRSRTWTRTALNFLGAGVRHLHQGTRSFFNFLGLVLVGCVTVLFHPTRIFPNVVIAAERTGVAAIPIIVVTAAVVGVVLSYEAAVQLSKFGAKMAAAELIGYSIFREAGVLITAVVMAGRTGSAFTAEIGIMKMREEIEALKIIGLNPLYTLILPRILALIIFMPILTLVSDIVGILAGGLVCSFTLDMSLFSFLTHLRDSTSLTTFMIGLIKAPFFGLVIGIIGCLEGMRVDESAESIAARTTQSVVKSIFMVILLNGFFSFTLTYMGV